MSMDEHKAAPDAPSGWTMTRRARGATYESGQRRIQAGHDEDGLSFTIAENGAWLPGAYADIDTAVAAFEHDDDTLRALQSKVNERTDRRIKPEDLATMRVG